MQMLSKKMNQKKKHLKAKPDMVLVSRERLEALEELEQKAIKWLEVMKKQAI
mgnify:CR=1 FL=1